MVKKLPLLVCLFIILLFGCQGKETPTLATERPTPTTTARLPTTPVPTQQSTSTPIPPSPTASSPPAKTATLTKTETSIATDTPMIPPETRLKLQCLEVVPALPGNTAFNGIVILSNGSLLDMATGQITRIAGDQKYLSSVAISLDNKFMAFDNIITDSGGRITGRELVIATADGQRQKVIPFEEKWLDIQGWTNDQRLLISIDEPVKASSDGNTIPYSYLILDPFSGERQVLKPDYPEFFDIASSQWGWRSVIYDPTLARAIYPRLIEGNEEMYTYVLVDVTTQHILTSLENIYANFSVFSVSSPVPHWSADGSQFVFVGQVDKASEGFVEFELYRVSRDGLAEQLTHLTSIAVLQGMTFSLSPDSQKIVMLLDTWYDVEQSHVAALDMGTLNVTDYCIPVRWGGGVTLPPSPIWSPDGKQFLVVDWYEKDHRRVILVDIVQGFAAQIAEDMEPVGWLASP